jgi:hypothetical protein
MIVNIMCKYCEDAVFIVDGAVPQISTEYLMLKWKIPVDETLFDRDSIRVSIGGNRWLYLS